MRVAGSVIVGILSILALMPAAQAAEGFYVAGSMGGYFREDTTGTAFAVNNHAITGSFRREYDPGTVFDVSVGYHLPLRFRVEAELGYAHNTVAKEVFGAPFNSTVHYLSGSDENRYSGTLNLFYDLPLGETVVPYIGGGLGGAHAENVTGNGVDNFGRTVRLGGANVVRGVALIEGGLNVALGERFVLVPAYRWTRFFDGTGPGATEAAHIVKIGLRYTF